MGITLRDLLYSPLDRAAARALVADVQRIIDDTAGADDAETVTIAPPPELASLSVVTTAHLRDDGERGIGDVAEDLYLGVEEAPPPTADEARAQALATGYAPSSFELEPAALERLAQCRSTIAFEYPGRLAGKRFFLRVQKLVFLRCEGGVLASGERTRLQTIEAVISELSNDREWARLRPAGERRPATPRRPRGTPDQRAAAALHDRLSAILEGDAFMQLALKEALARATPAARAYAAALLEQQAAGDAAMAKALGCSSAALVTARAELVALLASILE